MNSRQTYFLKSQANLIIVFKYLIIIIFLIFNLASANIIYDKNDILITEIELNRYINLYKENINSDLSLNNAIKNIVLTKKTIKFLKSNNPEYIQLLDEKLKKEYGQKIFDDQILLNFIRYQKIRNEFITDYFQNKFNYLSLKNIFYSLSELNLPISSDNCMTIKNFHIVNKDEIFISSFYENLVNNQKNFKTSVDGIEYDVCINSKLFNMLESNIISYIEEQTKEDFKKFIYGIKK